MDMEDVYNLSDEDFIKEISKMSALDLLRLIMIYPEYISDSYYAKFGRAISDRYNYLLDHSK